MFYSSHRVRIVFFLTTVCLIGAGLLTLSGKFNLDSSLVIALTGFSIIATVYAISSKRASLSALQCSTSTIAPTSTNSKLNSLIRDLDTAPNPASVKLMPGVQTPTFQTALREWIGMPSSFHTELRELLSTMSEVILVLDAEGRYLQIAPTNPALLYRPSEELVGKTLHQVFPQAQADSFLAHINRALQTHERVSFEYALAIDSNKYLFATTVSLLTENTVLWVARDVTSNRNAVNLLRENEERFRTLVEKSQDVITILDERGQAVYRTPSAARITGYSDLDRGQGDMFRLIHPEDLSRAQELFAEVRRQPTQSLSAQLRIQHKNGNWLWIEVTATNHLNDPSVRGIVVNYRDITGQKHHAEEIHRRNLELAALFQIGQSLARLAPLSEILETVHSTIGQALDNRNLYIALFDHSKQEISFPIYTMDGERKSVATRAFGNGITEYVLRTKAPLFLPRNVAEELTAREIASIGRPARSFLGVPMLSGDKAIGVIAIQDYDRENAYEPNHVELLSTIASQVASAIENARLYDEARKRADEFAALHETTKDLSALHDLPELLRTVVDRATALFNVGGGGMYLYDADQNNLMMAVAKGFAVQVGSRIAIGEGMSGKVAESRKPLIVDDYANWEGRSHQFDDIPFKSVLEVPMLYSGELVGVLVVHSYKDHTRTFTEQDARLLSLFASQAAGAVKAARLLAEMQKRANQLALFNAITIAASSKLSLQEMLQTFADRIGELFDADGAYIPLWDEERQLAVPTAAYGPLRDIYPHRQPSKNLQTLTQSVLAEGHALAVEDVSNSPYVSAQITARYPARSTLGLPLIAGGKKIGAIIVGFNQPHHFTSEEISLGEQISKQIAVGVAKAQLLEESQERAKQFESLYQVTRDLNSYKVLPELLQTILERATDLFQTPSGALTLYNSVRGELEVVAAKAFPVPLGTSLPLGVGLSGIVAQKREPVIVENYAHWEYRSPSLEGVPFCAALCVPMICRGELIGTLGVRVLNDSTKKFSAADARLLSLFASQAASAVRDARLFEETNTRADQMAMLYDAGLTLNRVLDPKLQLEFLVKLAAQTLKAARAIFYRYDPTQHSIHAEMAVGYDPETLKKIRTLQFSLDSESTIPGWVLQNRLAVNLGDVNADSRYVPVDPLLKSGLWVPIEHEGLPRGVLCVFSPRANAFTAQSERLLTLYANQVSTAMGNAELFSEINQRLVELEAINQLSTALRAARTRSEMLPLFLKQTLALFETDAGVIWLYNPVKGKMDQATASGWFSDIHEMPVEPGEGIAGHVFATGDAYLSREFLNDPLTRKITTPQIPAGWGGTCVPIRSAEKTVGVLFVAVPLPRQMNQPQARLLNTLAEIAGNTIHRMHLHESLEETFVQTIAALAHAIDARDAYTAGHSNKVSDLAVELASEMGLTRDTQEAIRLGGLLHDIGKIAIPDAILHKPGRLTPEEYALVKIHPKVGAQILEPIKQLEQVVPIVLSHQERFDGTGYPGGLAGESIPIGARILAVVDAFSSITDNRSYRPARTPSKALEEIKQWSGTQFDPEVVRAFQGLLQKRS